MSGAKAMTARLLELVTVVIPVLVKAEGGATQEQLNPLASVVKYLDLDADSDADLALLASAVEVARWVMLNAELVGSEPAEVWARYVQGGVDYG
jgi:hypothetical protein